MSVRTGRRRATWEKTTALIDGRDCWRVAGDGTYWVERADVPRTDYRLVVRGRYVGWAATLDEALTVLGFRWEMGL